MWRIRVIINGKQVAEKTAGNATMREAIITEILQVGVRVESDDTVILYPPTSISAIIYNKDK